MSAITPPRGPSDPPPSSRRASATVLQVCTRLNIGGPARHLDGLARELPDRFRTEVVAGAAPAAEGSLPVHAPTVSVPLVRRPSPTSDAAAYRRLRELIDARRPAIVATHTAKAGALGRAAAWRSSAAPLTVHTFHGHLLVGYFPPAVRRVVVEVERRLARRTDALVAVSPEVRDELLGAGIGDPSRWHVLPIALDLAAFDAARAVPGRLRDAIGVPAGVPLIGAVGRLAAIKDLGVLLRAARSLPGVHVALVGDGPEREALVALARDLGIADRVHLVGWWPDVTSVYVDLDAVVLTSRNEGTPSALIEASAAGRPVVATDVGGVRHVLEDDGWLVPAGSPDAVAAAVREVLAHPETAATRAAAARRSVLRRFDAVRSAAAHAALFDELLARGPRER